MKHKSINITQEIEFGRKIVSETIRHKSVVSLILRFHLINGQFVDPKQVQNFQRLFKVLCATHLMKQKMHAYRYPHLPICVIFTLASALTSTPFLNQVPFTVSSETSHLKTA